MSEININPIQAGGAEKHTSLAESLAGKKKAGSSLNEMIANNKAEAMQESMQTEATDLSVIAQTRRALKAPKESDTERLKKVNQDRTRVFARKEDADGFADQFSKREDNRKYHLDTSLLSNLAFEDLGLAINENSDIDEIIRIVHQRMAQKQVALNEKTDLNPALLNKGLEFLIEVTQSQINNTSGKVKERMTSICTLIKAARDKHFEANTYKIGLAEKIIDPVDSVVTSTGEDFNQTLNRCSDIAHSQTDLPSLRRFYEEKGYKKWKAELHALCRYFNESFKREHMENAEIIQLFKSVKKLLALDHVFLEAKKQLKGFFKGYLTTNHLV